MTRRPIAALLTAAALAAAVTVTGVSPGLSGATPSMSETSAPGINRLTGGTIPVDAAGIGGVQMNFLPQDARSTRERQIEQDITSAINYERTSRGMGTLTFSENLTAAHHRWNEMLASDPDRADGSCPPGTFGGVNCHSSLPFFDWTKLRNTTAGAQTVSEVGDGASAGNTLQTPGYFAASLVTQDAAHRNSVLTNRAILISVGVKCRADGGTYQEFKAFDVGGAHASVTPAAYTGSDIDGNSNVQFGRRCPQPAPTFTAGSTASGDGLTVTVTGSQWAQLRTSCAATPGGTAVNTPSYSFTFTAYAGATAVGSTSFTATAANVNAPRTIAGLAPGSYRVDETVTTSCDDSLIASVNGTVAVAPPTTTSPPVSLPAGAAQYAAVSPARLADQRPATLVPGFSVVDGCTIRVPVAGRRGVPANATAAVLTITMDRPSADGWAAVYPSGAGFGGISNVNFARGEIRANSAIVQLGAGGAVDVRLWDAACGSPVVVDVTGAFVPATGLIGSGRLVSVGPDRRFDTRVNGVGYRAPGTVTTLTPAQLTLPNDAVAVAVNITVADTSGAGYVSGFPAGGSPGGASTLNADDAGQVRAGFTIQPISPAGLSILQTMGAHLIVDVVGYFTGGVKSGGVFVPSTPSRVVNTRPNRVGSFASTTWTTPAGATAVVANWTITESTSAGWIAVRPATAAGVAGSSTVNASKSGESVANLAITPVAGGGVAAQVGYTTAAVVADAAGWFMT